MGAFAPWDAGQNVGNAVFCRRCEELSWLMG